MRLDELDPEEKSLVSVIIRTKKLDLPWRPADWGDLTLREFLFAVYGR